MRREKYYQICFYARIATFLFCYVIDFALFVMHKFTWNIPFDEMR